MQRLSWAYERTVPLHVNRALALLSLRNALADLGFEIRSEHPDGFEVLGPGMHSTKQDPLLGVSKAKVLATPTHLTVHAELGSVRRMQYFVLVLPCLALLFVCLIFLCMVPHGELFVRSSAPSLLLTWLLVGLLMGFWLQHRTTRALDLLLERTTR